MASPDKKTFRRASRDSTQRLRQAIQIAFLLLNLWIGWRFIQFVHHFEGTSSAAAIERPAGVEGWLPIAALMNLKYLALTGHVPTIHPAGMFLLIAFLGISILFRKAFCSWLCPVGTVSEMIWKLGRRIWRRGRLHRGVSPPRWFDIPLRGLKYILLGLFLYAVGSMNLDDIIAFLGGPYGLVADVKMLNFFRYMSTTAAVVVAILVMLSLFIENFWCRYLCPYGALLGLGALASPSAIRREKDSCIDCGACHRACPAKLRVDQLVTIRSAECTACLECVASCPVEDTLALSLPGKRRIAGWQLAVGIALIFFGVVGLAKLTGHWNSIIPESVYGELIPHAREFTHP